MFPKKRWIVRKRSTSITIQVEPAPKQVIINQPFHQNWALLPPPEKRLRPSSPPLLPSFPCPCYYPTAIPSPTGGIVFMTSWKGYCTNPVHRAIAPCLSTVFFSDNYRGIFHDCIQVTDVPPLNWGYADKTWSWQLPSPAPSTKMNVSQSAMPTGPQQIVPEFLSSMYRHNWLEKYNITVASNKDARSMLADMLKNKSKEQQITLPTKKFDSHNNENDEEMGWESFDNCEEFQLSIW